MAAVKNALKLTVLAVGCFLLAYVAFNLLSGATAAILAPYGSPLVIILGVVLGGCLLLVSYIIVAKLARRGLKKPTYLEAHGPVHITVKDPANLHDYTGGPRCKATAGGTPYGPPPPKADAMFKRAGLTEEIGVRRPKHGSRITHWIGGPR